MTGFWSTTATSDWSSTGIDGDDVICTVTEGGPVSNNKGMSLPGMNVSAPALSEKDIEDLDVRAEPRRRPGRAVVRALARRTSSWSTR